MQNPVIISDLEPRFRPLTTPAEQERAQALLADAWEELQARVPTMGARAEAGLLSDGLIRRVVTAMAVRVLQNPNAIRQWTIDDGTFVRDQLVSGGFLFVTPDEVALLSGVPVQAPGHIAFSASMGYGRW